MTRVLAVTIAVLLLPGGSAAHAATITIPAADTHRTVHCTGATVVRVEGAGSRITTVGACRSIVVDSAQTRVHATIVDRITINGLDSHVTYHRSSTGGRARVAINAVGGKVFRD